MSKRTRLHRPQGAQERFSALTDKWLKENWSDRENPWNLLAQAWEYARKELENEQNHSTTSP